MIDDDGYIRIGKIIGTHSLKGRLKVYIISDNLNRFSNGNIILLKQGNDFVEKTILEFKPYKKRIYLVRFKGIDNINDADLIKGEELYITRAEAENSRDQLDVDSYYYFDIIGSRVYLDDKLFGTVIDILEAGSGEILLIKNDSGNKYMIPFVESMVNTDKIEEKRVDIYPVEGLIDF